MLNGKNKPLFLMALNKICFSAVAQSADRLSQPDKQKKRISALFFELIIIIKKNQ